MEYQINAGNVINDKISEAFLLGIMDKQIEKKRGFCFYV